jgi:glucokinase
LNTTNHAIGIDIGGTKMAVALIRSGGQILDRVVLPTEAELGFDRAVRRLIDSIETLQADPNDGPLRGIGIGCAGPIDSQRGLINNPYTLTGWDRCDIVTPLRDRFNVPAFLENDADMAAFGECTGGAGAGFDPVVMLTFGTGIGGAAIIRREIYRGVAGEHPELGHILVSTGGSECYCGSRGCLESIASGTAIAAAGREVGLPETRAVFAAAAAGNTAASGIISRALEAAAGAAWTVCHTFLPQRLVLGGGMMEEHFERFAAAIKERLDPATQFTRRAVDVVQASLGNDAGIVGAACLALQRRG